MKPITICEDNPYFSAELLPDMLARLPTNQVIKLFGIMFDNDYLDDNRKSIEVLKEWIPEEFDSAKKAWSKASQEYADKWKPISNPRLKNPEIQKQKDLNKQLRSTVTLTRKQYNGIQKIQKCFSKAKHDNRRR